MTGTPIIALELQPIFDWIYELLQSIGLGGGLLTVVTYAALGVTMFGVLAVLALFLI